MRKTLWTLLLAVILFAVATVAINIIFRPDTAPPTSPAAQTSTVETQPETLAPTSQTIAPTPVTTPQPETPTPNLPAPAPTTPQEESLSAMVVIQNFSFNPPTLRIQKGQTVTWTNRDSVIHNAILNDGSGSTPLLSAGQSATLRFENAGSFSYRCGPHPWMIGTVVVTE